MEGCVAVRFMALDAGAGPALLADATTKLPSGGRNVVDRVDGLEKDGVGEADLGDPEAADHVGPAAVVGLLEGATLVGTEATFDRSRKERKRKNQ